MRNTILLVSLAGVFLLIIFFLFQQYPSSPSIEKVTEPVKQIGFYHYYSGTLSGGLADMTNEVNQSQTQFHVKATALDHEAFKSMILTMLDKENPPELFSYWAGARVQHLVDQGKLTSIDDLWKNQELGKRFSPSIVKAACTYNNKKYLLPIDQHLVVFFYNTQLFEEYQLKPPQTWDEFLKVCQGLKQKNMTPIALGAKERWPAQFWLDYLLLRTQTTNYRKQLMAGEARYIDPEVKAVYQIWAGLLNNGYFNTNANDLDWAQATQMVASNKAAMTLMGSWAIPMLQESSAGSEGKKKFDFFAFPVMDNTVPKVALGPIDGIVLSKNSTNHEFSKRTLTYFASQEAQKKMSLGSGALSPSLEVPLSFYSEFKKRLKKEIQTSVAWAFNYDLATPPPIAELGMNSFHELIEFPDQHGKILENLDIEIRIAFEQINNKN